jgi:hypothetical protein
MGIKRYKPEEIATKLRQVEVLAGQGMARDPQCFTLKVGKRARNR